MTTSILPESSNSSATALAINLHKKEGMGEDADPLVTVTSNGTWIGVFDGLGGSGAAQYSLGTEQHSGAYFASREARAAVVQ